MIYVGTSGFSYKEWKGIFYPEKLPAKEYLSFYSRHFSTTELNNTFYRIPNQKMSSGWAEQVPSEFRFAVKLNQRITHRKRLQNVEEEMGWFQNGIEPLLPRIGCFLVQLPPFLKKDTPVLREFLSRYAGSVPLAFEFRHESWECDETREVLNRYGATLVISETEEKGPAHELTGKFAYIRLRKGSYSDQELGRWAKWIQAQQCPSFVFLKHENDAPELAKRLLSHLA